MTTAPYRLPQLRWDAPITVWGPTPVDYAAIERKFLSSFGGLDAYRARPAPRYGDWIIWEANGRRLAGQIKCRRSTRDYEVYLLNPEKHTHIVVVQQHEIVKVRPNHLEVLAATA
jgi:hypothetical protein